VQLPPAEAVKPGAYERPGEFHQKSGGLGSSHLLMDEIGFIHV
jgi:hypothetical protein